MNEGGFFKALEQEEDERGFLWPRGPHTLPATLVTVTYPQMTSNGVVHRPVTRTELRHHPDYVFLPDYLERRQRELGLSDETILPGFLNADTTIGQVKQYIRYAPFGTTEDLEEELVNAARRKRHFEELRMRQEKWETDFMDWKIAVGPVMRGLDRVIWRLLRRPPFREETNQYFGEILDRTREMLN